MTRLLYLDCFAGASGDMFIGALIDCGLDFNLLQSELGKLGVEGYELSLTRVDRSGISASKFDVTLTGENHSHEHHDHDEHRSLSEIKLMKDDPAAVEKQSTEIKVRYSRIFKV